MGITYADMSLPSVAIPWFEEAIPVDTSGLAALCRAQMEAELGNWEEASDAFRRVAAGYPHLSAKASALSDRSLEGSALPKKSPGLAALLSATVPGAGQWYAGHHYDAVLAFGYVGTMAGATYAFWRHSEDTGRGEGAFYISCAVTAVLHTANILGARRTAQYRNMRTIQDHLAGMHRQVYPETVLPANPERRIEQ
jgi:hypothetical protein